MGAAWALNAPTVAGYGRAAVLDGSNKRQQPHCLQLPAITRYQPSDLLK
jgi:hypothetical protein